MADAKDTSSATEKAPADAKSRRRVWLRGAICAAVVTALGCGGILAFRYLENRVQAQTEAAPVGVQVRLMPAAPGLAGYPAWAPARLLTAISQDLTPPTMRFTDRELPDWVYRQAKANPWLKPDGIDIRKVDSGNPAYGIVQVRAQFRAPVACVKVPGEDAYEYVDAECIVLPSELVPKWIAPLPGGKQALFANAADVPLPLQATPVHYIRIEGVQAAPPEPGQKWEGQDLADGVKMVSLVYPYRFFAQIASIDVSNREGRLDKNKPVFVMIATTPEGKKTEILMNRFRRPEGDWVVPPEESLRHLNEDYFLTRGTLAGFDLQIDARGETLTSVAN